MPQLGQPGLSTWKECGPQFTEGKEGLSEASPPGVEPGSDVSGRILDPRASPHPRLNWWVSCAQSGARGAAWVMGPGKKTSPAWGQPDNSLEEVFTGNTDPSALSTKTWTCTATHQVPSPRLAATFWDAPPWAVPWRSEHLCFRGVGPQVQRPPLCGGVRYMTQGKVQLQSRLPLG